MTTLALSDSAIGAIMKIAPEVASALLGPVSGSVVGLLATVFGVEHTPDKPVDQKVLEQKVLNDPDAAIKLKQLALSLAELEVKRADIDTQNLASARAYDIQSGSGHRILPALAVLYSAAFLMLLLLDALHVVDIVDSYVNHLYSIALIVINFYFGASFKKS